MYQVNDAYLTLPKFTNFLSEAINGINYNFVTTDATTVSVVNNQASFPNTIIRQGTPASTSYLVDETSNPKFIFKINDKNIDTTTLQVLIQQSTSNSSFEIYNQHQIT
jgi:hypothetical protein